MLEFELKLKPVEKWHLRALFGLIDYNFEFYDFKYDKLNLDFKDIVVRFSQHMGNTRLYFVLPTLKSWSIETTCRNHES